MACDGHHRCVALGREGPCLVVRINVAALEDKSRSLERATAELRAANEQLKSLDRLKDDFMSSVTHELRTPLTSIRALSEMMAEDVGMPEAQRREFLRIINAETERLSRLVNQVLDMAKIESGHAQWRSDDVDLLVFLASDHDRRVPRDDGAKVAPLQAERSKQRKVTPSPAHGGDEHVGHRRR